MPAVLKEVSEYSPKPVMIPNRAYVELTMPTISRSTVPAQPIRLMVEGETVEDVEVPSKPGTKGKQLEGTSRIPAASPRRVEMDPGENQDSFPESGFRFEVKGDLSIKSKLRPKFNTVPAQPVALSLGDVVGLSLELGRPFLKTNQSRRSPLQKSLVVIMEYGSNVEDEVMSREGELSVDCGGVRRDDGDLHGWPCQAKVEKSQTPELVLAIDKSGSSWTLQRISSHTMSLEGICWDIPIEIGAFPRNFFVVTKI